MSQSLWKRCLLRLESDLSEKDLNTWIRPLHAVEDEGRLELLAPNAFVLGRVQQDYLSLIRHAAADLHEGEQPQVERRVGAADVSPQTEGKTSRSVRKSSLYGSKLDRRYTFETFVEGKSNQIARA